MARRENNFKFAEILYQNRHEYVSGEHLAGLSGISRTAVWKEIKKLRDLGCVIDAIPRKGYRLDKLPDIIIPSLINSVVRGTVFADKIYYFEQVSSTNEVVKNMARQGEAEGVVVIADMQTHGKGRLGRTWHSPPGSGLWMSFLLRPSIHPLQAGHLPLLCALAAAEACMEYNIGIGLKWPNDLMWENKKIGGILLEMSAECERINFVVVGIGVNVNRVVDLAPEIEEKAGFLSDITGERMDRNAFAGHLLVKINEKYKRYCISGFGEIKKGWLQKAIHLGKNICISDGEQRIEGRMVDIGENGELILKQRGRLTAVYSGDVEGRKQVYGKKPETGS